MKCWYRIPLGTSRIVFQAYMYRISCLCLCAGSWLTHLKSIFAALCKHHWESYSYNASFYPFMLNIHILIVKASPSLMQTYDFFLLQASGRGRRGRRAGRQNNTSAALPGRKVLWWSYFAFIYSRPIYLICLKWSLNNVPSRIKVECLLAYSPTVIT